MRPSFLTLGHEFSNNKVLRQEPLLPALQALHLLVPKTFEGIQRAVEVLGEHFLVEAMAGKATAGIATGEVLVGAAGSVEVLAARDVEDPAPDTHVHGHAVRAVVGEQRARGECAEDDRGRLARQRCRRRRLVQEIRRV